MGLYGVRKPGKADLLPGGQKGCYVNRDILRHDNRIMVTLCLGNHTHTSTSLIKRFSLRCT